MSRTAGLADSSLPSPWPFPPPLHLPLGSSCFDEHTTKGSKKQHFIRRMQKRAPSTVENRNIAAVADRPTNFAHTGFPSGNATRNQSPVWCGTRPAKTLIPRQESEEQEGGRTNNPEKKQNRTAFTTFVTFTARYQTTEDMERRDSQDESIGRTYHPIWVDQPMQHENETVGGHGLVVIYPEPRRFRQLSRRSSTQLVAAKVWSEQTGGQARDRHGVMLLFTSSM